MGFLRAETSFDINKGRSPVREQSGDFLQAHSLVRLVHDGKNNGIRIFDLIQGL